jgi:predicted enzyme related to lactoylglutathione lyase
MVMVKLSRIAPELPVSDLKQSVKYYQQKLGFRVAVEMPGGNYAILERDDIAIHLFQDDPQRSSPVAIHIFTEDLEALHTELKSRGARISQEILRKPWGNRDFRVSDVSGNEIKFTEPLSSAD